MNASFRLGQLAPPFLKMLGATVIAYAAGAVGADKTALHDLAAVDPAMVGPACTAMAGIFINLSTDQLKSLVSRKDYGFGGSLRQAYRKALKLAFISLRGKCLERHRDMDPDEAGAFLTDLEEDYTRLQDKALDTDAQELLEAYVYARESFFESVLDILHLDTASPEARLLGFVAEEFPQEMRRTFLEQLLKPEHEQARMGFLVYLGEENLRLGTANRDTLLSVSRLLEGMSRNQQLGQQLQQDVLGLQNLAFERMRQMGLTLEEMKREIHSIFRQVAPRLPLSLPGMEAVRRQGDLFQFKAAYTAFIGREKETKVLDEFFGVGNGYVDDEQPVRWLLVTGPGGVGKSRLALHYCELVRKEGFDAGFLTEENFYRLQDYRPDKPSLVVIDYVAARHGQVQRAIKNLYRRKSTSDPIPGDRNICLLLLERDTKGKWWEDFEKDPEVWGCGFGLEEHKEPVLPLSGFGEAERWQIIEEVYRKSKKEAIPFGREEILTELDRLDPKRRPLFAIFVGISLADGQYANLREWNVHNLLDSLLDREKREFWRPRKTYGEEDLDRHQNLLALMTLTQGLSQDAVSDLCERVSEEGEWLPDEPDTDLYSSMAQIREEKEEAMLEGLQPDLLGEYFVLKRLEEWVKGSFNRSRAKKAAVALIQEAWEASPDKTWDFINKALRDYHELAHSMAYQMLLTTPPAAEAREQAWSSWGWLLINGTANPFAPTGELADPVVYYNFLKEETRQPTEEASKAVIILQQAIAAKNLIILFCSSQDQEQAERYYGEIVALSEKHVTSDIALEQAQAAAPLILYFWDLRDVKQAERYYGEIVALSEKYATPDIALEQTKAAYNLSLDFCRSQDKEQADRYYREIVALSEKYGTPKLALWQAQAAYNLAILFGKSQDQEQAERYYEEIVALYKKHGTPDIALEQAQATYNLSLAFCKLGDLKRADRYYREIVALSENHGTPELALWQAQVAVILSLYFWDLKDVKQAERYYGEIVALSEEHGTSEIAHMQAQAAHNLSLGFCRYRDVKQAERYYGEIVALSEEHGTPQIAHVQTQAAKNLSVYFGESGDLKNNN